MTNDVNIRIVILNIREYILIHMICVKQNLWIDSLSINDL